ncbi:MAG: hypothetical protein Q8L10_04550 [Candidatus Moranbacteria bacterium]|nr:hypothetical protein [Candidatus Moranbacteria bacterium]
MKNKHKIALIVAALAVGFLWSGNAKADYWTRHTRSTSGNALPEHLELENMTKSSNGVRFLYGNDRVDMNSEASFVRHIVKYNGTNWSDETSTVEAAGYSDIEFLNMYADQNGNVWMPNRKDPNVALLKYGADGNWTSITSATIGSQVGVGGNLKIKNLFGNRDSADFMYAVATNDTRLYLLIYTNSSGIWTDSGFAGGPLVDTNNNGADFWGMYNEEDNSFWFYQYHSSENQFSNPDGGDVGSGIWRYKGGTWTQFNKDYATGNGVALKNGVTDAFVDSSGDVWVGTRYGVFRYDISAGTWANWTKDNSNIFTDRVQKVQEDSDGRIWIVSLAVETSTDANNRGGISIYDPSTASWDYYTSHNGETALDNATNIFMIGGGSEAWMFTGHGEEAMSAGIYALTRDDTHTALYGQVSGATVEKASLDSLKKSSAKKVTITKKYRVQKKNKRYKWKKKVVYRGKSTSGWYKKLNLDAGTNIKYIIKIQGKRARTISASTGDPIKVSVN